MRSSRIRVLLVTALALLGVSLAVAGPASAHDRLISSDPAAGASVAAPENVTLTFSAAVLETGAQVKVTAPDDSVSTSGKPTVAGSKVTQQVDASAPGTYSVSWRVTSSDGHPIAGKFTFTVKAQESATAPATSSQAPAATGTTATTASGADTTTTPTMDPTTRVGTDETSNRPWLVIGLAIATLLVVVGGAIYARGRLRDDD